MKKALASLVLSAALVSAIGCSNWNRNTPGPLDNTTIEEEIRKNLLGGRDDVLAVDLVTNPARFLARPAETCAILSLVRHVPDLAFMKGIDNS